MANAANKAALQSEGGGDVYAPPDHLIDIAEADPSHPHHHEHVERVRLDKPEMVALIESMRAFGWRKSVTIAIYKDGDRFTVSEGRRRLTALRFVNAERKAAKNKAEPIRPRVVLDDDPTLTTTLANAMREDDPPMVKARRFVENRETMGASKAAAAAGLSLADANLLAAILSTPNADLHTAVNTRAVDIGTAAKAAKAGSATVRKVLEKSRGEGGKIDGGKARDAARAAVPVRLKARSPKTLISVASELEKIGFLDAAELIRWMQGGPAPVAYVKAIESAEAMRRAGGKAGKS